MWINDAGQRGVAKVNSLSFSESAGLWNCGPASLAANLNERDILLYVVFRSRVYRRPVEFFGGFN